MLVDKVEQQILRAVELVAGWPPKGVSAAFDCEQFVGNIVFDELPNHMLGLFVGDGDVFRSMDKQVRILFLYLPCITDIFVPFPPSGIPFNLYHRETLWSNTEKSLEEMHKEFLLDK